MSSFDENVSDSLDTVIDWFLTMAYYIGVFLFSPLLLLAHVIGKVKNR